MIKEKRGQYWIKEYIEKNIDYLKGLLEWKEEYWSHVDNLYVNDFHEQRREIEELSEIIKRYEEEEARKEFLKSLKSET